MLIYIVVGVSQGAVDHIKGFIDHGEALAELGRLQVAYNIVLGQEEESENTAELHEIDIDARPTSVMARRQIW